jgi:hypothetical protein
MKAKIEFDLDDPSDKLAHKRCTNATEAYIALHQIENELRSIVKYQKLIAPGTKIALPDDYHEVTEKESDLLYEVVWSIRNQVSNIIQDLGINLDDLE